MRRCFQALLSTVRLQLPVFPCVPFLACDFACLACTVQTKVVSTSGYKVYNPIQFNNGKSEGQITSKEEKKEHLPE